MSDDDVGLALLDGEAGAAVDFRNEGEDELAEDSERAAARVHGVWHLRHLGELEDVVTEGRVGDAGFFDGGFKGGVDEDGGAVAKGLEGAGDGDEGEDVARGTDGDEEGVHGVGGRAVHFAREGGR